MKAKTLARRLRRIKNKNRKVYVVNSDFTTSLVVKTYTDRTANVILLLVRDCDRIENGR